MASEENKVRLHDRHPGTATTFIDSASGEHVLQIASDDSGALLMAYRLYDDRGALVAQSAGLAALPFGLAVHSQSGELLLNVPAAMGGLIQYRLYGRSGRLLTYSDGARTRIYPHLRMEGNSGPWAARVQ